MTNIVSAPPAPGMTLLMAGRENQYLYLEFTVNTN